MVLQCTLHGSLSTQHWHNCAVATTSSCLCQRAYWFVSSSSLTLIWRLYCVTLVLQQGIIEGAKDGKGRGRQVIATARTSNMLLICLDAMKSVTHKKLIERELDGVGIRLNQTPPDVTFKRKDKGGLNYQEMVSQVIS